MLPRLLIALVSSGALDGRHLLDDLALSMGRLLQVGLLWTAALLALSCGSERTSYALEGPLVELPEAQAFQAASKTLTLDGMNIVFLADVWRNFSLNLAEPDREIKGARVWGHMSVRKKGMGHVALPDGVAIDRIFVVREDRVWVTMVENRETGLVGSYTVFGVDELPKWTPGTLVDVYAELRMPGGPPVYLAVRGVKVIPIS